MNYRGLSILVILGLLSCGNDSTKTTDIKPLSSGKLSNITVVANIDLWEGASGSAARQTVGGDLYGLPQDEPMFDLHYMPQKVFSGFTRKNRTVLMLLQSDSVGVTIVNDAYAKPQTLVEVSGPNDQAIAMQLNLNKDLIIRAFQESEVAEKQRQIAKSLNKDKSIFKNLGLTLNFPSAYRIASTDDSFVWARRDIESGSVNFIIYELNKDRIDLNAPILEQIIAIRDSVGEKQIPGPVEGSYMITEKAYAPQLKTAEIAGHKAYETRSTWELANAFMAGPFVNYTIYDPKNSRWIVAEGFVLAPSKEKRDYMLELEAILKSIKI